MVIHDLAGAALPRGCLLAGAARASLESKDLVLALQFAQMSLRLDKNQPLALSPTMKLKRAKLEASVADKLEGWYAQQKPVQWA